MQINGLINMLMTLPGAAGNGLLPGTDANSQLLGGQLLGGQIQGQTPGQTPSQVPQDFASLINTGTPINPNLLKGKAPITGDLLQQVSEQNNKGVEVASADAVIIPQMPTFIDQPVKDAIVLDKDNVLADNAASKKLIWENELRATNKAIPANAKIEASEVDNAQEVYGTVKETVTTANTKTEENIQKQPKGAINLASLDTSATDNIDQAEFAAAVSRLSHDKLKPSKPATHDIQAKVIEEKTVDLNAKTLMNEKAAAFEAAKQPEQVAAKISAKILDVKTDKVETTEADQIASRLQELDTQLRSRDFNLIKSARETLAHTPAQQVHIQISQAMKDGVDNIKINLNPAELGSVDVSMDIDSDGKTQIHIVAERTETLDLLRRDAQQLSKSLADAGVQADANSLQFSLRGDSQGDRQFGQNGNGENTNKQVHAAVNDNYSRFSRITEGELKLSIANKSLNILV